MANNSMIFKNQEKGVSLIITFFILTIILAVVLSISILLYGQIKIIRNIGNSVVAFYAADSGVEKVLYYDRRQVPTGVGRGICNICNICPDCTNCLLTGLDCTTCSSCNITFDSKIDSEKTYKEDVTVSQQCRISGGTISSYGFYEDVSRAIRLDSTVKVSSLNINNPGATVTTPGQNCNMTISAEVLDPNNIGIENVVAAITGLGEENINQCYPIPPSLPCTYREITMSPGGGGGQEGSYQTQWNFGIQSENYTIKIMATDNAGYCVEVSNITISCI